MKKLIKAGTFLLLLFGFFLFFGIHVKASFPYTLTKNTDAFNAPNGKKIAYFAPQRVNVLTAQGSWYQISTGLGPLWINTQETYTLSQYTEAFNAPNGTKVTTFAPQKVNVISTQGSWNQISTGLGPLWINTTPEVLNPIGTLTLTSNTDAFVEPNGAKATYFGPQRVTILNSQGKWYQISTGIGKLWVNMSTITLPGKVDAYNKPNGGKITTFGPQSANVVSIQNDWYEISTGLGPLWVNPNIPLFVPPATPQNGQTVVNFAEKYLGMKYIWASSNPVNGGFDCSGYIYYVFENSGYHISRLTVADYWNKTTHLASPQIGDLVFFKDTYTTGPSHMGIYIGNNEMVDAQNNGISIDNITYSYWNSHFLGYGRF